MTTTWEQTASLIKVLAIKGDKIVSITMAWMLKDRAEILRQSRMPFLLDMFEAFLATVYAFVNIFTLFMTRNEVPDMPLRLWITINMFQCILQVAFFVFHQPRRYRLQRNNNLKLMEKGKDIINIILWTFGTLLVAKGNKASYNSAPLLTGVVMYFTIFDFVIFIAVTLLVTAAGGVVCCCIPFIYLIMYFCGDQFFQEEEKRLPPCPFCHCSFSVN